MDERVRHSELLPLIRSQVRERLLESPAFRSLPPAQRTEIAHHTVNALHYIVGGEDGTSRPSSVTLVGDSPLARELAQQKDPAGDTAGQRFAESGAVAAREGGEAMADLVSKIDFPRFVAGLIDGVFNAIVASTIQQMEAFAELVKNVSKSVDQYMKDNVSENNARDWLADRYPDHLEVDITGRKPLLKAREGADENNLPDFAGDLGMDESLTSLDNDAIEDKLVPAARRRVAMDRQQLLATLLTMGLSRLVVTNGTIEASCLFELDTRDEVKRKSAVDTAYERERYRSGRGTGVGFAPGSLWFSKSYARDTSKFKVSTTRSEDSTAKVDLHAKLGGKVNVVFRSDHFPLEKMVDVLQVNSIRERSAGGAGQLPAAGAPAAPDRR